MLSSKIKKKTCVTSTDTQNYRYSSNTKQGKVKRNKQEHGMNTINTADILGMS